MQIIIGYQINRVGIDGTCDVDVAINYYYACI